MGGLMLPGARVNSGPGVLLRVMSGSIFLPQLGSVLTSLIHAANTDYKDARHLAYHLALEVSEGHAVTGTKLI